MKDTLVTILITIGIMAECEMWRFILSHKDGFIHSKVGIAR